MNKVRVLPTVRTRATPTLAADDIAALTLDMESALAKIAAKHGLAALAVKSSRLRGHGLNFMVQAVVPEFDQARTQWLLHATEHGLDPALLDAVVTLPDSHRPLGREYTVLGLRVGHGPVRVKLQEAGTGRELFLRVRDFQTRATVRSAPCTLLTA